jgi:GNAT superfamily N-acetyltransferase
MTASEMRIRSATQQDLPAAMNVLDGADLAVSAGTVRRRIDDGRVLLAESGSGTVIGALVALPRPDGAHVEAIAVRPKRRGQGVGSDLVAAAGERWGRLTAAFDPTVSDFYRRMGFEVAARGERCFGERASGQ